MAAMFFEICKYPYSLLFPLDRDTVYQISSDRTTVMRYSFFYSATKWQICAFFFFDQNNVIHVSSLVKISHCSRVIAFK